MRLSKSKINSYLKCPREFKYAYIDGLEREENIYFKIGLDVHNIAETFINLWKEDNTIDILKTLLKLESECEDDYKDHCINLASFFKDYLVNMDYEVFTAEEYLLCEEHNFSGLADLVLEKDNKLTLIDYKTGKTHSVKNYVNELCYYKMLIEDEYPDKTVEYGGIYFTKNGDFRYLKFTNEDIKGICCTSSEYCEKIDLIDIIRDKINSGQFEPKRQFLCKYCDFKEVCDKEGGF